jgi:hypothetical protein
MSYHLPESTKGRPQKVNNDNETPGTAVHEPPPPHVKGRWLHEYVVGVEQQSQLRNALVTLGIKRIIRNVEETDRVLPLNYVRRCQRNTPELPDWKALQHLYREDMCQWMLTLTTQAWVLPSGSYVVGKTKGRPLGEIGLSIFHNTTERPPVLCNWEAFVSTYREAFDHSINRPDILWRHTLRKSEILGIKHNKRLMDQWELTDPSCSSPFC